MSRLHWTLMALVVGCGGGSTPPAETPETETSETPEAESAPEETADAPEDESDESTAKSSEETPAEGAAPADPEFPENASVAQAIDAIPKGTERLNSDPEDLGKPLQDAAVYEPCKLGGQHIKLRVAIWNGKAVGIDVDTKNKKLADCVRTQIQGLTWPKVRSLETVDFAL